MELYRPFKDAENIPQLGVRNTPGTAWNRPQKDSQTKYILADINMR
jgi:hypothetical protein